MTTKSTLPSFMCMLTLKSAGFLGLGSMGSAIAEGVMRGLSGLNVFGHDPRMRSLVPPEGLQGMRLLGSAAEVEEQSDIVFLCVKPTDLEALCRSLKGQKRYVSIAAGIGTRQILSWLPRSESRQLARVMPNLSAQVAQSASAIYCPDAELRSTVMLLLEKVGHTLPLDTESLMHGVTGLSGSGPAFVFAFIHALAEGGTAEGLPYPQALELAAHTVRGAADLLIRSGEHPGVLRNRVTSPAGTTIAGLEVLETNAFHGAVLGAVRAAAARSRALGSQ